VKINRQLISLCETKSEVGLHFVFWNFYECLVFVDEDMSLLIKNLFLLWICWVFELFMWKRI